MRKITCLLLLLCLLPSFALADKTITLTFTGDITLGGEDYLRTAEDSFFAVYDREGAGYFLKNFADFFAEDDLTVVNLEGVLTDNNALYPRDKGKGLFVGLDQDGTVSAQGQGGAQLFLSGVRADGDDDDLASDALLFQANGLFDGDFAEGVHRHLDVGEVDAGVVRFDADFDVVVDHSFDSYKNLHGFLVTLR